MSAMTREEMLRHLGSHGEDAGSDYNDSEEIHGRFGWSVGHTGSGEAVLSVTYEDLDDGAGPPLTLTWRMVPMGAPKPFLPATTPTVDFPEGGFPQ